MPSNMTLEAAAAAYLAQIEVSRTSSTTRSYRTGLKKFLSYLNTNGIDISSVEASQAEGEWLEGYLGTLSGLAPATVQTYFWSVYGWYQFLSSERIAQIELATLRSACRSSLPKRASPFGESPRHYDLSRIVEYMLTPDLESVDDEKQRLRLLRDRALIVTLADCEIEVGMIARLRKGDIDWKTSHFWVLDSGRKRITVSFTQRVAKALLEYLNARHALDKSSRQSAASLPVYSGHGVTQGDKPVAMTARAINKVVTQRAQQALGAEYDGTITAKSFRHYSVQDLLEPLDLLHPQIARKCRVLFETGQYDDAIFNAMKVVEDELRTRISADATAVGVNLVTKALHTVPTLITLSTVSAEQESAYFLFRGALGSFKNPHSHRFIGVSNPIKAFECLALGSLLLRMLDEAV